jgi:DNA repair protein RadA/Sms
MVEEVVEANAQTPLSASSEEIPPSVSLSSVDVSQGLRMKTGSDELDRVLGGGLVPASLILVGGDPGIGKSTLILQVCAAISEKCRVLYISVRNPSNRSSSGPTGSSFL